jgi:hypothetical protein
MIANRSIHPFDHSAGLAKNFTKMITIIYLLLQNSGVGRIRTSGLQRPRLASYQARQRPLSFRRKLSLSECNFNLMNKLETVLSQLMKLADNWYRVATVITTVVGVKIPRINAKAVAPDDHSLALGAVCVF